MKFALSGITLSTTIISPLALSKSPRENLKSQLDKSVILSAV
jgi:hypothetical protein